MKKFIITPGDIDGVGMDITIQALNCITHQDANFELYCSPEQKNAYLEGINDLKNISLNISKEKEPYWFIEAVEKCKNNNSISVITGPLSKTLIQNCGLNYKGHTDVLRDKVNSDVSMFFYSEKFSVGLVTDHIPLNKVSTSINKKLLSEKIQKSIELRKTLGLDTSIAILGLNPHAGENGILGDEEKNTFHSVIHNFKKEGVFGPFPADSFFMNVDNRVKYKIILSPYHDQGLIAFKSLNGFNGCQISLGMPFLRVSVNHGTAKDVVDKKSISHESMLSAIEFAYKYGRKWGE